ncbi:MAG TPA: hypothetical protein VK827_02095 [Lysobacter sp.]|nr:hypothetical protein [Lysobacter sp.]
MLLIHSHARLALLPVFLLLGACATSRSTLALDIPAQSTVVSASKVAVIDAVTDQRTFEEDPDEPSTPSLKKGEKYSLDAQGRSQAIARKRNGYGMAIGDIMLEGDKTVESLTRGLVTQGLQQRGYRVAAVGEAVPADALKVRVDVGEFWAWITPGMWAGTIEARVNTSIQATTDSTRSIEVLGYGENIVQTGRDLNWQQAYERAFNDYLDKFKVALDTAGL